MASDPSQLIQSLLQGGGQIGQSFAQGAQNAQTLQQNAALAPVQLQQAQINNQIGQQQVDTTQAAQAEDARYQADLAKYVSDPTPQAMSNMMVMHPGKYQALKQGWDVKSDAQAKADLGFWGGVDGTLGSGDNGGAAQLIHQRLTAERAMGVSNPAEQEMADKIDAGDPDAIKSVKAYALAQIAAATGPDKFADTYKTVQGNQDLAPDHSLYDGQGNLIVTAPSKPDDNKPEYIYDAGLHKMVMKPYSGSGASNGSGAPATGGDTSRLVNNDAGGGQVPSSVQTLGQFVSWGKGLNAKGAKSSSAGTYQINGSTMAQFAPRVLGADWKDAPYTADAQDKVGEAIFNWAKSQPDPAAALKNRWVSLSGGKAAQLVAGSWQQARGTIAQGESNGSPTASATAPTSDAPGTGGGPFNGYPSSIDMDTSPADKLGGLTQDGLDYAVNYAIANGGKPPTGFARSKATMLAMENGIAAKAKQSGMSVQQIIQMGQDTSAAGKIVGKFTWGPQADAVRSLNVAIDHGAVLHDAILALHNGNIPLFNKISNGWAQSTGSALPTNAAAIGGIFGDEVTKAVLNGKGGVTDREDMHKQLNTAAQSPDQGLGLISSYVKLLAGQANGLKRQYEQSNRTDFARFLSPNTARALGMQSRAPGTSILGDANHNASGGAVHTATGANGEKYSLVGGRWVQGQ